MTSPQLHPTKWFVALLMLMATSWLSACHDDIPDDLARTRTATPQERTIIMYLPYSGSGSNDLYPFFEQNILDVEQSIKQAGGLGTNNLYVVIADHSPARVYLYRVRMEGTECVHDTIKRYDYPRLMDAQWITRVINDVRSISNTPKYAMLVGCHGNGWLPPKDNVARAKTRWFGGPGYAISIADFAQGIQQAGIKLEYLVFDDCYLSCAEVAYDLRNATNTLIASTSEVMAAGMPYAKVFQYLAAPQPNFGQLVNDYIAYYQSTATPYATIGVINTQYIQPMAQLMRQVNATCTWNTANNYQLQDLDGSYFSPTVYFDFGSYARALFGSNLALYSQYRALMAQLIPYKGNTAYIYNASGTITRVNEFSGITISDPSVNTGQYGYHVATLKMQTAWWAASH
ncbi:clostripain-related cysteine peptidase [Segatella oulorum]|uniref:clostripain-related cysteine peptidase n=1 Tax=Segatella oulorum TaxID=28136 RepID=UPI0028E543CC|nr:clostripain-related cysteine peptidase [Segatella oulorum]